MEGSETDQCVDGAGTGVIQKERRVRKPSQKAKALQEATKAKVTPVSSLSTSSLSLPPLSLTHPLFFFNSRLKPR